MGDPPALRVETPALNWEPAVVTVPPVPVIPPGGDPMSLMISSIMPTISADLTAAVAETHAREQRFAGNLTSARTQYETTDGAGEQAIRTVSDSQLGPAGAASASGAGGGGQFGQLMGTAMQMASQAAQAPAQVMGMVAQAPQAVMQAGQGAVQQITQMTGQLGGKPEGEGAQGQGAPGGGVPDVPTQESAQNDQQSQPDAQRDKDDENKDERDGAAAGPNATERAPEVGTPSTGGPTENDPINL